jgi:hypothetical protein
MGKQTDGRAERQTYWYAGRRLGRKTDIWVCRQTVRQKDRNMGRQTDGQAERQTDRYASRQSSRMTNKWVCRQTDRQKDR